MIWLSCIFIRNEIERVTTIKIQDIEGQFNLIDRPQKIV